MRHVLILRECIEQAAKILNDGDIFLISFSGHGGQMQDIDSDEKDFLDSTWVFYDRQLTDDELENLIRPNFIKQVRILIISSAAHAGAAYMGRLINKKNQKSVSSAMKDMSPILLDSNLSCISQSLINIMKI